MPHLSIRDLQKISSETIAALPGPTLVKSGARTIAILTPVRPPNVERLRETLKRAEELAKDIDPAEIDRVLREAGAEWTEFSEEEIRALRSERS